MQWNFEWTWDGGGGGWLILMIKSPGNYKKIMAKN